jgi:rhodanese-related sulfurtransferase
MKKLNILAIVMLSLGLILAFVPKEAMKSEKVSQKQIISELKEKAYFITADALAAMLVEKDPTVKLVDVRDAFEFQKFSLPNATNLNIENIVSDEWSEFMNQDKYTIVIYSNGNVDAVEAWMLCRMKGYENIFVLQGGLNNWYETILNPQKPASTMADEELAKYEFRKAAGSTLGGGVAGDSTSAAPAKMAGSEAPKPKPAAGAAKKKKGASGGCG